MAELATVELKLSQKQKVIKSQQPTHSNTMADVSKVQKKSRRRKFMEADMDNSLGNDGIIIVIARNMYTHFI
jgi:hypothetical protein